MGHGCGILTLWTEAGRPPMTVAPGGGEGKCPDSDTAGRQPRRGSSGTSQGWHCFEGSASLSLEPAALIRALSCPKRGVGSELASY